MHNKPLGCGASEVYASGPACEQEETHAEYSGSTTGPIEYAFKTALSQLVLPLSHGLCDRPIANRVIHYSRLVTRRGTRGGAIG